jgi:hypothetical protein
MPIAKLMLRVWYGGKKRIYFRPILVRKCKNYPQIPVVMDIRDEVAEKLLFGSRLPDI